MKRTAYSAWDGDPPNLQYLTMPMPDAPYLPLTGTGTTSMSLAAFLNDLESDLKSKKGHFFEYVWESDKEEADTYALEGWEVFIPESGFSEVLVILYYSPINPYLTLRKHFGEEFAESYLESVPFNVDIQNTLDEYSVG